MSDTGRATPPAEPPTAAPRRRYRPPADSSAAAPSLEGLGPSVAGCAPRSDERRDPLLVKLFCLSPLDLKPPADLPQLLEHVAHRARCVSTMPQPLPVALDLPSQPSGLPPRSRHCTRLLQQEHGAPAIEAPPGPATMPRSATLPRPGAATRSSRCEHLRGTPRHSHGLGIDRRPAAGSGRAGPALVAGFRRG